MSVAPASPRTCALELHGEGLRGAELVAALRGRCPELGDDLDAELTIDALGVAWRASAGAARSAGEVAAGLSLVYGLPDGAPLERVEVFGRRADAPTHLHLRDGTVIRLELGDLLDNRRLALALGAQTNGRARPDLKKSEALRAAYFDLLALAVMHEEADETGEVDEWIGRFLATTGGQTIDVDLADGASRYEALGMLQRAHYLPQSSSVPIVLRDPSGELLARASDLLAFVREVGGARDMSAQRLGPRLLAAGYGRRLLEQWKPGADRRSYPKRKVTVYVLTPDPERRP